MCKPASMIATRPKMLWSRFSDSHEDIVREFNLDDSRLNPQFVRVEISPSNGDYTHPLDQWIFRTDQDRVPDWYDPTDAEKRCRIALQKWAAAKLVISGSREIRDGQCYAYGSASVEAYGSASVRASDSASVRAYGRASVRAYGRASVRASDSASVEAYGSATVINWSKHSVVTLNSKGAVMVDRAGAMPVCTTGA